MTDATPHKVAATHLARQAFLYVRQSTLRQVAENQESTRRQYALRERATALGWTAEQIVVIDCDLGLSGATAEREGFQRLVAEVGMGHAGIVLGLEVSRLARNSTDWHRLLEICALTETLILDEDGLYDPTHDNDRLLLGLKGTISEAELHLLRARMRGGLLAKAQRGELRIGLPVGFVYDEIGRVVLHPDAQVRDTVALFFRTFQRTGAACATVKHFSEQQIPFPAPARSGARMAQVVWGRLNLGRAVQLLHNPRDAGAFAFGRRLARKQPDGRSRTTRVPHDAGPARRGSRATSGSRCGSRPTRPTSRGTSSSGSRTGSARRRWPTGSTGITARRARGPPCSRGVRSAGAAGCG
jgi:DNA invertase Pin-like site-specific DNA recombinase